jgi:hypothetical protein
MKIKHIIDAQPPFQERKRKKNILVVVEDKCYIKLHSMSKKARSMKHFFSSTQTVRFFRTSKSLRVINQLFWQRTNVQLMVRKFNN